MNEDYAQPAWAKHHDRLAADLSRGIARLRRLLRGSVAGDSLLPGMDRRLRRAPAYRARRNNPLPTDAYRASLVLSGSPAGIRRFGRSLSALLRHYHPRELRTC